MFYENHKNKLLITSILFLLLGVAFIVYPATSMIMLVRFTGAFLILVGLMILIPTLRDRKYLGIRFGLLIAVAAIVGIFGIILLVWPDFFVEAFWITMGIILILDGIKIFMYLSAVPYKLINIILAVVSVICGVLIIIRPFGMGMAFTIVMGAFYVYSGAAGIFLNIAGKIRARENADEAGESTAAEMAEESAAEPDAEPDTAPEEKLIESPAEEADTEDPNQEDPNQE
ncbi:MAG: DUF308 domain-containing protein [Bacillota bacterium]|nr:DUF308 domain-containing protein [Bacillota bacterium]